MSLIEFTGSKQFAWHITLPWGGGHTLETDPTKRGWRMRAQGECLLIGRKGQVGCFSAMRMSGNILDIAVYDDIDPKQVSIWLAKDYKSREYIDCWYRSVPDSPGWALYFVSLLESHRTT